MKFIIEKNKKMNLVLLLNILFFLRINKKEKTKFKSIKINDFVALVELRSSENGLGWIIPFNFSWLKKISCVCIKKFFWIFTSIDIVNIKQKIKIVVMNLINSFLWLIRTNIKNGTNKKKIKNPLSKLQKKVKTLKKLIIIIDKFFFVLMKFNIELKKIIKGKSRHIFTLSKYKIKKKDVTKKKLLLMK